jgi:hypothetical protein
MYTFNMKNYICGQRDSKVSEPLLPWTIPSRVFHTPHTLASYLGAPYPLKPYP